MYSGTQGWVPLSCHGAGANEWPHTPPGFCKILAVSIVFDVIFLKTFNLLLVYAYMHVRVFVHMWHVCVSMGVCMPCHMC